MILESGASPEGSLGSEEEEEESSGGLRGWFNCAGGWFRRHSPRRGDPLGSLRRLSNVLGAYGYTVGAVKPHAHLFKAGALQRLLSYEPSVRHVHKRDRTQDPAWVRLFERLFPSRDFRSSYKYSLLLIVAVTPFIFVPLQRLGLAGEAAWSQLARSIQALLRQCLLATIVLLVWRDAFPTLFSHRRLAQLLWKLLAATAVIFALPPLLAPAEVEKEDTHGSMAWRIVSSITLAAVPIVHFVWLPVVVNGRLRAIAPAAGGSASASSTSVVAAGGPLSLVPLAPLAVRSASMMAASTLYIAYGYVGVVLALWGVNILGLAPVVFLPWGAALAMDWYAGRVLHNDVGYLFMFVVQALGMGTGVTGFLTQLLLAFRSVPFGGLWVILAYTAGFALWRFLLVRTGRVVFDGKPHFVHVFLVQAFQDMFGSLCFLAVGDLGPTFLLMMAVELLRKCGKNLQAVNHASEQLMACMRCSPGPSEDEQRTRFEGTWIVLEQNLMSELLAASVVPLTLACDLLFWRLSATPAVAIGLPYHVVAQQVRVYGVRLLFEAVMHLTVRAILRAKRRQLFPNLRRRPSAAVAAAVEATGSRADDDLAVESASDDEQASTAEAEGRQHGKPADGIGMVRVLAVGDADDSAATSAAVLPSTAGASASSIGSAAAPLSHSGAFKLAARLAVAAHEWEEDVMTHHHWMARYPHFALIVAYVLLEAIHRFSVVQRALSAAS